MVKDYSRNQSLTDARGIRAIDSAAQYVQSHLGLPGHEREYTFNFFDTDITFALPVDFGEPISLRFQEDRLNFRQPFTYKPSELIFQSVDQVSQNTHLWGLYSAGTANVMYVLARNSTSDVLIDTFDSNNATNWTASLDATNITTDSVTFKEGSASLSYDITVGLSGSDRASITYAGTGTYDLSTFVNKGSAKFWKYIQSVTNYTSVSLTWGTDASNYYKSTQTAQEDGTAFVVGWNRIACPWQGATVVGTPNAASIAYFKFDDDYTAAYTSQAANRIDDLRFENPDVMVMTYYTTYVGKNAGGTYLSSFSATTDTFLWGGYDTGIKQLVALQAAIILNPQILVDDTSVRRLYDTFWKLYSRKYPLKLTSQLKAEPQISRTSRQSP